MTSSGVDNRQQGTKNYSMTAWLGTRVCFIDLTWSKRPGRRPLQFSKPGTIIRQLIFQIMLRAPGDRKQPCALSNVISVIGFPRTSCSGTIRACKTDFGDRPCTEEFQVDANSLPGRASMGIEIVQHNVN